MTFTSFTCYTYSELYSFSIMKVYKGMEMLKHQRMTIMNSKKSFFY